MQNRSRVLFLTQFSILLAIEAIFSFTPLGSLPALGPIVATLFMLPVIVTAILLGTKAGTLMGAFAALFSFLVWTFMPPSPIAAFVFTPFYTVGEFSGNFGSILICFIPRILGGTITGFAYKFLSRMFPKKDAWCLSISGALGSLVNTFGVMGGIWIFFSNQYSSIAGVSMLMIIGTTILTSGIPEAIVSAVTAVAVGKSIKKVLENSVRNN